ncbi:Imm50 family immunity protein [Burkholderia ambifaria]|uniref:Imm50 family immunity protein n=1 Tax=Burkholderia ambifaria TaxID=152480 RepID=UPI003D15F32B
MVDHYCCTVKTGNEYDNESDESPGDHFNLWRISFLIGAELTEVRVARDEPRISVRFATERRPIKHPARWPQNYDEIYIGISFVGVCDFSFFQWGQKISWKRLI